MRNKKKRKAIKKEKAQKKRKAIKKKAQKDERKREKGQCYYPLTHLCFKVSP